MPKGPEGEKNHRATLISGRNAWSRADAGGASGLTRLLSDAEVQAKGKVMWGATSTGFKSGE